VRLIRNTTDRAVAIPSARWRLAAILAMSLVSLHCSRGELGTLEVGKPAPPFTLVDLNGDKVNLKTLTDNGAVLVNFWASWCAPCKEEVPLLNDLHRKYRDRGITVVGVSVEEARPVIEAFARRHPLEYPVLLDSNGAVSRRYGLIGMPMTVLIDRTGVVSLQKYGIVDEQVIATLDRMQRGGRTAAEETAGVR
jgi:peroxiredoxin